MSRGAVVRKPLSVRERSSRPLDQRLVLRFPQLAVLYGRLMLGLPPTSRIRQAMLWRSVRLGIEAFNRRDFEAVLISYHPEVEFHPPRGWRESGMSDSSYRGPDGFPSFLRDLSAVWGAYRQEPRELIDLGDRFVVLGELTGRAQASGVPLAQPHASLYHLGDGKLVRQEEFLDPAEALEAVGLQEPTLSSNYPPFDAAR